MNELWQILVQWGGSEKVQRCEIRVQNHCPFRYCQSSSLASLRMLACAKSFGMQCANFVVQIGSNNSSIS